MTDAPYLKKNRLADVIAAIQSTAMNERSSLACRNWAEIVSGDVSKEGHWRAVFDEHPEFFRKSPNNIDHYALVWRRALPRRYYRPEGRLLSQNEFEALSAEEMKLVSRPPVPETQIETLVDIAITLHAKQEDQNRDRRWWIPIVASFLGSVVGATIGGFGVVFLE